MAEAQVRKNRDPLLFVWAIPIFFFQSTPFALKLRGHFINISMMILAKGILITRPATLFFLVTPRCLHTAVRTFDTAQLFILKTVQNTSSEAKMCI